MQYTNALQLISDFKLLEHIDGNIQDGQRIVSAKAYYAERVKTANEFLDSLQNSGLTPRNGPETPGLLYLIRGTKLNFMASALRQAGCFMDFIARNKPVNVAVLTDDVTKGLCCAFSDLLLTMDEKGELA